MTAEILQQRKDKLQQAKVFLKTQFIGLDEIIDKIIQNMESWYVAPELLSRPVIINLWGMTGVGKTDLIRKLVRYLDLFDSFVELEMAADSHGWEYSIKSVLQSSSIEEGTPGILLLDEMQKFRTINEQGLEIRDLKFADVWSLLSDGKMSHDSTTKEDILWLWATGITEKNNPTPTTEENQKPKPITSYWEARRIKKLLKITDDISDIMLWTLDQKISILKKYIDSSSVSSESDYSKLLIFICGNLDEAYKMAEDSEQSDIDADVYHEFSKNISIIDIKKALQQRFKPEQIARFGNTHLIYPALSRSSYIAIIQKTIATQLQKVKEKTNIEIIPDSSIIDMIYQNGVYPTQGTRPVFSTIHNLFESQLSLFILEALKANINKLEIKFANSKLSTVINDTVLTSSELSLDLDKLRDQISEDSLALQAVHEAGHAVVHLALFGSVPIEIKIGTSSRNGYMQGNRIMYSFKYLQNDLIVGLAGHCAELLILNTITEGARSDLDKATELASKSVREFGMGKDVGAFAHPYHDRYSEKMLTSKEQDEEIKHQLDLAKGTAEMLLTRHLDLLKKISKALFQHHFLSQEDIFNIAKVHFPNLKIHDKKEILQESYSKRFSEWIN